MYKKNQKKEKCLQQLNRRNALKIKKINIFRLIDGRAYEICFVP